MWTAHAPLCIHSVISVKAFSVIYPIVSTFPHSYVFPRLLSCTDWHPWQPMNGPRPSCLTFWPCYWSAPSAACDPWPLAWCVDFCNAMWTPSILQGYWAGVVFVRYLKRRLCTVWNTNLLWNTQLQQQIETCLNFILSRDLLFFLARVHTRQVHTWNTNCNSREAASVWHMLRS